MDGQARVGGVMTIKNPPRDGEVACSAGGGSPSLRRAEVYDARRARREMSLPEVLLWQRLKGSPQGIAFRKQHPIEGYRADFYCAAAKLVIEVDGTSHDMGDRPQRDERRTERLEEQGYSVLRIAAADVLKNADEAAQAIVSFAASPLRQPLRDCHLPVPGRI
jgi:very-short-patch-repair endonuclease